VGHSIVNVSSAIGLLLVIAILLRSGRGEDVVQRESPKWVLPVMAAIVFAAFAPGMRAPFLHDSCFLVYLPSTQTLGGVLQLFHTRLASGDYFYRPLAFGVFWGYSKWAAFSALRWHLLSIGGHALNTCLVYVLARRLRLPGYGAVITALLFALHGARPEAVTWVAARVDVLATVFVLLSLLVCLKIAQGGPARYYVVLVFLAGAALASKESAFCLPLLVSAMLLAETWTKRASVAVAMVTAVTIVMFLWRQSVLGTIGGYGAATGHPTVLQFSALKMVDVLCFRLWGLLAVPLNWSLRPGWVFWLAGLLVVAGMVILLRQGSSARVRLLLAMLAMTLMAALPVQHLLLIGADLSGSRLTYLPSLGFCLFLGGTVGGLRALRFQWFAGLALIVFQLAALQHNLFIWRKVAAIGRQASDEFVRVMPLDKPMTVLNLPAKRDGVPFLQNCFQYCLVVNSGAARAPILDSGSAPFVRWNDADDRFERVQ
jgi:protein O-mannosyl-transferase